MQQFPAPREVAERLSVSDENSVIVRRLRFLVDGLPVQLISAYYETGLASGSRLEQPVLISDGTGAELRQIGVQVARLVEDLLGTRLPQPDQERALLLPSGVPVIRNARTAYAGDEPVEVLDTIAHGEVPHRFEVNL